MTGKDTTTGTETIETPETEATEAQKDLELRTREIQLTKAEMVATTTTSMFDPVAFAQMEQLAVKLIKGGAASKDADTPEKLLVKLQAGFELGLKPIESLNSVYIVNGRVTLWGSALIGQFRKHGWDVAYSEEDDTGCTITVRKGEQVIFDRFVFQDAVDSGYVQDSYGKDRVGWKKGQNRKLKMRYGAANQLAKTYLPEVLGSTAGVTEIYQDAPWTEAEIVEPADEYAQKIKAAASREEIMEVVQSAPIPMRTKLVEVAEARMKALDV